MSCNGGNDGSIDLTASGGTEPYTFQWSNGSTQQNPEGLAVGTYCVTVTDANGCTKTTCATVTQPAVLTLNVVPAAVSCNGGANGAINLTVTGGTPDYTYLWNNGATTQDLSGVPAGTYCVTVTDLNGCTKTTCATITQPAALTASAVATDDACFQQANGDVDLTVAGGAAPYIYLWSNGAATQDLVNVAAGTYCVTVTDANGCTASTCVTVLENPEIILSTVVTNVLCNGGTNGAVNLTVNGGSPGYTYQWSNGATTQNLNNVPAGTYCVTVTDASGCTRTTCATVSQPAAITLTSQVTNVSCSGGNNGAVDLTVTGGTQPYSYSWTPGGATTQDISNLTAGSYTVTVTDANGCTKMLTVQVTQPAPLGLGIQLTMSPPCSGKYRRCESDGNRRRSTPYTYQWSNGSHNGHFIPGAIRRNLLCDSDRCKRLCKNHLCNDYPANGA